MLLQCLGAMRTCMKEERLRLCGLQAEAACYLPVHYFVLPYPGKHLELYPV